MGTQVVVSNIFHVHPVLEEMKPSPRGLFHPDHLDSALLRVVFVYGLGSHGMKITIKSYQFQFVGEYSWFTFSKPPTSKFKIYNSRI